MSETPNTNDDPRSTIHAEGKISILDILIVFAKRKTLVLGLPLTAAVLAAVFSMFMQDIYTATTKILAPRQNQSATAGVLAQLGGLGGATTAGALGISGPNDLYIAMLKSRRVADGLIKRFDLNALYHQKLQADTRAILASMTQIKSEKDGTITVEVAGTDRKFVAVLANAYVDELYKLTSVLAVTDASQRRLFFERQVAQAKDNLAKSEVAAKSALANGGLVQVEGQGRAMLEATVRLRGQITAKEVQIGSMRTFAAAQNPQLLADEQELEVMKRQLAKLEGAGDGKAGRRGIPNDAHGIDTLNLLRDVKYYESMYEMLSKQYELAKLDEAKDSALIQVLDEAIEPDFKSKPNRKVIVLLAGLAALLMAILLTVFLEAMAKVRADPQQVERLQVLRRYLFWRSRGNGEPK